MEHRRGPLFPTQQLFSPFPPSTALRVNRTLNGTSQLSDKPRNVDAAEGLIDRRSLLQFTWRDRACCNLTNWNQRGGRADAAGYDGNADYAPRGSQT